jgi:hypothetical protein
MTGMGIMRRNYDDFTWTGMGKSWWFDLIWLDLFWEWMKTENTKIEDFFLI